MKGSATAIEPPAGIEVLDHIVVQHVNEAAFCWSARDAAAVSPAYNLDELCAADDRLEAHLDGVRVAGDSGWALCCEQLDEGEPGSLFVAGVLALERRDLRGFATVLDACAGDWRACRGVVSALAWLPFEVVERAAQAMVVHTAPPVLQRIGIAVFAAQRRDPGDALGRAVRNNDGALRARALQALGQLQRRGQEDALRRGYEDADDACRFWASWSGTMLGDGHGLRQLMAIADEGGPHAEPAAALAVRRLETTQATEWLYRLADAGEPQTRAALVGTAALGTPSMAAWLIEQMHAPERARLAADAFAQITGANVADDMGAAAVPQYDAGPNDDPDDDHVAMDPDSDRPWPDISKIMHWWQQHPGRDTRGSRWLLGQPMAPSWLTRVLAGPPQANQRARHSAALELVLRRRAQMPYEVRAAGYTQLELRGGG